MIRIICGDPGSGKTSLMGGIACLSMTVEAKERVDLSNSIINMLNSNGYHFNFAKKHVTYTNFYCRSDYIKWFTPRISYDLDGIDFGLEDSEHKTKNIFPCSVLFFMEGQSFLDSRKSKYFRQSVSRAYENHRHWGLDIYIDAQRATLIDLNIRGISGEIIEVQGHKIFYDRLGNIKKIKWYTRVFQASQTYEKYLDSGKLEGDFETRIYEFPGDIFKCYLSENNFALFLDGREDKMFWCQEHKKPEYSKEYVENYCKIHSLNNQKSNGYWQKGVS